MDKTYLEATKQLCDLGLALRHRDSIVLEAYWAGVPKIQISRLTSLGRTTIDAIIEREKLGK